VTLDDICFFTRWMDDDTFEKIWRIAKKKIYNCVRNMKPIRDGLTGDDYERETRFDWIAFIMDGHSTHVYNDDVNDDAYYHKIVIINYIPHTTHVCQPLDSGMNEKIKVGGAHYNSDFSLFNY